MNEKSLLIITDENHPYIKPVCEEVFNEYYDTAGNYHWQGTYTGCHDIKAPFSTQNQHNVT